MPLVHDQTAQLAEIACDLAEIAERLVTVVEGSEPEGWLPAARRELAELIRQVEGG